ncbi:hypothetical protein [Breoghania sp. L-A4]|nr:hypothetical protein [Breoghania sp. L-A4]
MIAATPANRGSRAVWARERVFDEGRAVQNHNLGVFLFWPDDSIVPERAF